MSAKLILPLPGIEEVFGEEIQAEQDKVTKPQQYKTIFSEVNDGTRYKIHNDLKIKDTEIRNQWTMVSKNCYDMSSIKDIGVESAIYDKVMPFLVRTLK